MENSLYASLTPERWRSTAYGIKFILVFGVGAGAVWIVRFTTEAWGLASVYFVMTGVVLALLSAIAGLIAVTSRGRSDPLGSERDAASHAESAAAAHATP